MTPVNESCHVIMVGVEEDEGCDTSRVWSEMKKLADKDAAWDEESGQFLIARVADWQLLRN